MVQKSVLSWIIIASILLGGCGAIAAPTPLGPYARTFDLNRNELIEFEESGPKLSKRFTAYDSDRSGALDAGELRVYFQQVSREERDRRVRAAAVQPPVITEPVSAGEIDRMLAYTKEVLGLPGIAFIAAQGDTLLYKGSVGEIETSTVIPFASASKWVAAIVVMKAVEQGLVDLDQPASTYMPALRGEWREVTLRQMFSLTSGAEKGHALRYHPEADYLPFVMELAAQKLRRRPGSEFTYGGTPMQIGGFLIEQAGDLTWGELFKKFVTGPLGMSGSFFGHSVWHKPGAVIRTPNISGGLHSSADDYFALLKAMVVTESAEPRFLSAASVAAIETDYSSSLPQHFRPVGAHRDWSYGLGLWCEERDGRRCLSVSSAGAYGTYPWIDRRTNSYGIVVTLGKVREMLPFALKLRELAEKMP